MAVMELMERIARICSRRDRQPDEETETPTQDSLPVQITPQAVREFLGNPTPEELRDACRELARESTGRFRRAPVPFDPPDDRIRPIMTVATRRVMIHQPYLGTDDSSYRDLIERMTDHTQRVMQRIHEGYWLGEIDTDAQAAARQKAMALLKSHLSGAQQKTMELFDYFIVKNSRSRNQWRIRTNTTIYNVALLDEHESPQATFCAVPDGDLPPGDIFLTQKFMLEADEAGFLRVANRQPDWY